MIFRNIILNALLAGLLAGVLLSFLQLLGVSPIILAAEEFEVRGEAPLTEAVNVVSAEIESATAVEVAAAAPPEHDHSAHDHGHAVVEITQAEVTKPDATGSLLNEVVGTGVSGDMHTGHTHDAAAWAPEDGAERTFYTFASNILAAIGFSAVLLAFMVEAHTQGMTRITPLKGLVWGGAGFVALFVVPAVGLPPEIPGMEAAAIDNRQGWWLLAVSAAAVGLACLAFAPVKLKAAGLLLMALPYLVGAPHQQGPGINHPDAKIVAAMTQLHAEFVMASALINLVFWLVLGVLSAYLLSRKVLATDRPVIGA